MLLCGVPAHEDRQETQQSWRAPHHSQHDYQTALSHNQRVVQRLNYGVVPVHTENVLGNMYEGQCFEQMTLIIC